MQRWAEMAAFTPVMRTHEGNRPADNLQIDSDPEILAHFARMTRIYRHLVPYLKQLVDEAVATGMPVQRPLFLHFENDGSTYAIQDSYLYGPDLLVAPVHEAGATQRTLYLPAGEDWLHIWSATTHPGGAPVTVDAPIGQPPILCRANSTFRPLFEGPAHRMTPTLVAVLISVASAAATQRITGLGFALVSAPLLVLAEGPHNGVLLANLLSLVTNLVVLAQTWRSVEPRRVALLAVAALCLVPGRAGGGAPHAPQRR